MTPEEKATKREKIEECSRIIRKQIETIAEICGQEFINGKFYALRINEDKISVGFEITGTGL